jgi:hypothetical protein
LNRFVAIEPECGFGGRSLRRTGDVCALHRLVRQLLRDADRCQ